MSSRSTAISLSRVVQTLMQANDQIHSRKCNYNQNNENEYGYNNNYHTNVQREPPNKTTKERTILGAKNVDDPASKARRELAELWRQSYHYKNRHDYFNQDRNAMPEAAEESESSTSTTSLSILQRELNHHLHLQHLR